MALQQETIVSRLSSSSQQFLQHLNLSLLHPFCQHHDNDDSHVITVPARNVPPMGPLQSMDFSFWDHGINAWYHTAPPLLALSELWLRLFASLIAPLCVAHLLWTILHSLQTTKTKDSSKTTKATNDKNIHQGHHHTKNGTSTSHSSSNGKSDNSNGHDSNNSMAIPTSTETSSSSSPWTLVFICILGVAASVVLLTDTLYVLEFGPYVGATYLVMTTCLAVRMVVIKSSTTTTTTWSKTQRSGVLWSIVLLWCLTIRLLTKHHYDHSLQPGDAAAAAARLPWFSFGNAHDAVFIEEGLYYDNSKATASQMARQFQTTSTTNWKYAPLATKWMPTGDARTGLPFLLHQGIPSPTFLRVWLPVPSDAPSPMDQENNNQTTTPHDDDDDWEYVALDIAFPVDTTSGFDPSQPVYLILHGLNGGSQEEFVKDFTNRRTGRVYPNDHSHEHNMIPEHATVVVMVARGLMDVPIRGWNVFHGARTSDAHEAALALQRTLQQISSSSSTSSTTSTKNTMLAGVGYSMGAIILSNYVARYGKDCPLQAAVAISGGLDMRQVITFYRAQRLWQPMITTTLRHNFVVDKWGERVRARLTRDQLIHMLRSTHITVCTNKEMECIYIALSRRGVVTLAHSQIYFLFVDRKLMKRLWWHTMDLII